MGIISPKSILRAGHGQGYPHRILHSKETLSKSRVPVWTVTLIVLLSLPFQKGMLVEPSFGSMFGCAVLNSWKWSVASTFGSMWKAGRELWRFPRRNKTMSMTCWKRRRRKYVLRKSAQTSSSSTRLQKQRSREKERPDCRNVFSLLSVVGVIVGPSLYLACNCGLVSDS